MIERLSPHFTLAEMVRSSHRTIDNTPPPVVIERLRRLCLEFLEPVRQRFGPLWVTSGYRCPELNKAIDGSSGSAHMFGCAADFESINGATTIDIVRWIAGPSGLLFDQAIDEKNATSSWVHLGMLRPNAVPPPRRDVLSFRGGVYSAFAPLVSG